MDNNPILVPGTPARVRRSALLPTQLVQGSGLPTTAPALGVTAGPVLGATAPSYPHARTTAFAQVPPRGRPV